MKRNNYIMILSGTLFGIILMGIVLCAVVSKIKLENNNVKAETEEKYSSAIEAIETEVGVESEVETEEKVIYAEEPESAKETTINKSTVKEESKSNNNSTSSSVVKKTNPTTNTVKTEIQKEETNVVKYFTNKENEIFTSENIQKYGQYAKDTFIEITDFIFYGTEINGYTFDELTNEVKIKVMDLAVKLDAKIEQYFPGYKQTLKTEFTNFFTKLTAKYKEVTTKICNEVGTETCENAKKGVLLTLDLLEDLSKASLQTLKSWYEQYRTTK